MLNPPLNATGTAVAVSTALAFTIALATAIAPNLPSFTIPNGEYWRVKAIALEITCNATVANRQLGITASDGAGNEIAHATTPVLATAGQDLRVTFAPSLATGTTSVNGNTAVGYPELSLPPASIIRTSIISLQAGDILNMVVNYEKIRVV